RVACPERLPAASTAATASAYPVAHASPANTYEVCAVVPTWTPPRYSRYPATPTLSVEARHDTPSEPGPATDTTNPPGTDGAGGGVGVPPLPSLDVVLPARPEPAHAWVVAVTFATGDWWPAASSAATPSE